ncbi:hypothetical protein M404DRAFT_310255 [Pisolithus tinctorius Marx 270]|uniref:Uncharacterized protein n=1 Tax=Pisolithus tinctorius Marx 270 TaxID=870435 RepID=A0A0C3PKW1_PISTI|nr:hypothetical protein M404DRAFT_310255 [Pisolithus tinctorius Marx 270]
MDSVALQSHENVLHLPAIFTLFASSLTSRALVAHQMPTTTAEKEIIHETTSSSSPIEKLAMTFNRSASINSEEESFEVFHSLHNTPF